MVHAPLYALLWLAFAPSRPRSACRHRLCPDVSLLWLTVQADKYVEMAAKIQSEVDHVSASVYTQTTDVELECDGFLNYDRSNKFSAAGTAAIKNANQAIINAGNALNDEL